LDNYFSHIVNSVVSSQYGRLYPWVVHAQKVLLGAGVRLAGSMLFAPRLTKMW